jgi:hypothetical protein
MIPASLQTIEPDEIQLRKFPGLVIDRASFVGAKLQYEFAGRKPSRCLLDRKSETVKSIQKRIRILHIFFCVIEGVQDGITAHQHGNGLGQRPFRDVARE